MTNASESALPELMARANAANARLRRPSAVGVAAEEARRTRLLLAFSKRCRRDQMPRRCAWCGRIEVGGVYACPSEFLTGDLHERIKKRATHGICPDCYEREQANATTTRAERNAPQAPLPSRTAPR